MIEVPLRLAVCGGWANPKGTKGTGSENYLGRLKRGCFPFVVWTRNFCKTFTTLDVNATILSYQFQSSQPHQWSDPVEATTTPIISTGTEPELTNGIVSLLQEYYNLLVIKCPQCRKTPKTSRPTYPCPPRWAKVNPTKGSNLPLSWPKARASGKTINRMLSKSAMFHSQQYLCFSNDLTP